MLPNFTWFFLREKLPDAKRSQIKSRFRDLSGDLVSRLDEKYPQYGFFRYNSADEFDLVGEQKPKWTEIGIKIERTEGTYAYNKPLIRGFFGLNNFLVYLNKLDPTVFPKIMLDDTTRKMIKQIEVNLHAFLSDEFDLAEFRDFINADGFHNCILNCATCCDASEHSCLPLEGGVYCKALSSVGRFCMHKLFGIPTPDGYEICEEYYCSDVKNPVSYQRSNLMGCQLHCFIPEYTQKDMDEFFNFYNSIRRLEKKDSIPESILNSTRRGQEICLFWRLVNTVKDIMMKYKEKKGTFYQEFANLFNHNEYKKLMEKLEDPRTLIPDYLSEDEIENIKRLLRDLMDWQQMYSDRNARYDYDKTTLYH